MKTSIEWTEHSINPIRAKRRSTGAMGHYCQKISPGCANCYASRLQTRFGMPEFGGAGKPISADLSIFLDKEKLNEVRKRRKPTTYFWCDMSDLFGDWVPDEWIDQCFATMAWTHQHTHQVLTKRSKRMMEYSATLAAMTRQQRGVRWARSMHRGTMLERFVNDKMEAGADWPLPNVWLGVSVEDQARVDERVPHLLQTPAAIRFLSCEPLLGPIDLTKWLDNDVSFAIEGRMGGVPDRAEYVVKPPLLHWLIAGGESGFDARPCAIEWIRQLRDQCQAAGVPIFIKQLGREPTLDRLPEHHEQPGTWSIKVEAKNGKWSLRLVSPKGGKPSEWPEDLRVRQMPAIAGRKGESHVEAK